MALVIEDGTSKSDAESFVTLVEARDFASKRGLSLPTDDTQAEQLLRKAADFFRSLSFQGVKSSRSQALAFPRSGMVVDSEAVPDDEIPVGVKYAQIQLAVDAQTTALLPTGAGREVIKEKVDVLEVEYAPTGATSIQPVFNEALAWLEAYLDGGSFGINASIVRG
jgi:hypothetical protein